MIWKDSNNRLKRTVPPNRVLPLPPCGRRLSTVVTAVPVSYRTEREREATKPTTGELTGTRDEDEARNGDAFPPRTAPRPARSSDTARSLARLALSSPLLSSPLPCSVLLCLRARRTDANREATSADDSSAAWPRATRTRSGKVRERAHTTHEGSTQRREGKGREARRSLSDGCVCVLCVCRRAGCEPLVAPSAMGP
jgi:hypothetical protein